MAEEKEQIEEEDESSFDMYGIFDEEGDFSVKSSSEEENVMKDIVRLQSTYCCFSII